MAVCGDFSVRTPRRHAGIRFSQDQACNPGFFWFRLVVHDRLSAVDGVGRTEPKVPIVLNRSIFLSLRSDHLCRNLPLTACLTK